MCFSQLLIHKLGLFTDAKILTPFNATSYLDFFVNMFHRWTAARLPVGKLQDLNIAYFILTDRKKKFKCLAYSY